MTTYILDRMDAVRFVAGILTNSKLDSLSITITVQGNSEDFYVSTATDTLSVDIEKILERIYSEVRTSTYQPPIPAGLPLPKSNDEERNGS